MKQYLFIPAVLAYINKPDFFTRTIAWTIRVFAGLFALGAVIGWVQLWKAVFNMNDAAILGGVLFQICFVIGAYMALHVLWLRAADVEGLKTGEEKLLPIVPLFLKMSGEVYASLAASAGVGKGLLCLFVDQSHLAERTFSTVPGIGWEHPMLVHMFGGNEGLSSFINAILYLLGGAVGAVVWLVFFYLLAELFNLLLGIARNLQE